MITIQKEPSGIYPAYNDSYLHFDTSYTSDDRALINIDNKYNFTIYPDPQGDYLFNMREVVKAIINGNKFEDNIDYSLSGWGFSDESLYKAIDVEITAYGDGSTSTSNTTYTFNKAVKQYGDIELNNPYQLMLPSKDGINYYLTYFEGYPMEIPFKYLDSTDSITIKNERTEQITNAFSPSNDNPYRLFIDKGASNWNSSGILELPDMMSRLFIRESGVNKAVIELTKKANKCGKYLKWFNSDGSYSYWLFNQWYKKDYSGTEIDRTNTNNFNNVYGNQEGITRITGKTGERGLKLRTAVTEYEKDHLVSLVTSPVVWMWSEESPYQNGEWIKVKLTSKGFTYANKKAINQLQVDIQLPEINTQTL
jgi:hypothetical protein